MAIDITQYARFPIRMLQVHRKRLKNGVGDHRLANWPTSY